MDWTQVDAAVAVGGAAVAVVAWLSRAALRELFTPLSAHSALAQRVMTLEHRVENAPGKSDFNALTARLGIVETGIAVTAKAVEGIGESVKRVEHMTGVLLEHQLDGEREKT